MTLEQLQRASQLFESVTAQVVVGPRPRCFYQCGICAGVECDVGSDPSKFVEGGGLRPYMVTRLRMVRGETPSNNRTGDLPGSPSRLSQDSVPG